MLMKKITTLFTVICAMFAMSATAQVAQTAIYDFTNGKWGIPGYQFDNASGATIVNPTTDYTDGTGTITIEPRAKFSWTTEEGKTLTTKGNYYYENGSLRIEGVNTKIKFQAFGFAVEKIEVVCNASKGANYKNVDTNIYVGETAVSTACIGSTSTHTFEIAAEYQAAGNIYELVIGQKGGQYSSIVYIDKINIYPAATEDALKVEAPQFDKESGVYSEAITVIPTSSTATAEGVSNVNYYYTTDGSEPTKASSKVSAEGINITASCTIKAIIEFTYADKTYTSEASSAEYIISPSVTYSKYDDLVSGDYFIVANGKIAAPLSEYVLPAVDATVADGKATAPGYYTYKIEVNGYYFYIKDANGNYLMTTPTEEKNRIHPATDSANAAWENIAEKGETPVLYSNGFILVYDTDKNAFTILSEDTESEWGTNIIYPELYASNQTTGIDRVAAEVEGTVIYDLAGRRIEKITNAGIYIVNGKKVLVK